MTRRLAALALCLGLAACGGGATPGRKPLERAAVAPDPAPSPSPEATLPAVDPPGPAAFVPAVDEPIPADPERLAPLLAVTTRALQRSVDAWTSDGGAMKAAPAGLVRQALYQQRIYRLLGRTPSLAGPTLRLVPGWLRPQAQANTNAIARLVTLSHPVSSASAFRVQPPKPAGVLLRDFKEGERRFGVPWQLLAAVNFIESKFGRVRSNSSAGAQGPMQFLPGTWAAYGMGGDVHDPHDAVLGAANYLHASGSPGNDRRALFAYNPSDAYVDAVSIYASRMSKDPRAFFEYYHWQVFVFTTHGDERRSGPWPR